MFFSDNVTPDIRMNSNNKTTERHRNTGDLNCCPKLTQTRVVICALKASFPNKMTLSDPQGEQRVVTHLPLAALRHTPAKKQPGVGTVLFIGGRSTIRSHERKADPKSGGPIYCRHKNSAAAGRSLPRPGGESSFTAIERSSGPATTPNPATEGFAKRPEPEKVGSGSAHFWVAD